MTTSFQSSRTDQGGAARPTSTDDEGVSRVVWTPPDVIRVLTVLAQNFVWLVLAPIFGLGATVAYLLLNNPTYEVGAQLMVRFGQEMAAPATVSATSTQLIPLSKRIEDITAEVQIMKNPAIIREVVDDLGEDFFYGEAVPVTFLQKVKQAVKDSIDWVKDTVRGVLVRIGLLPELSRLDRVVLLLQNSITIEHVTRSDVIELGLGYPDPYLGEVVLNKFIDVYLEKRSDIFRDERITVFFESELDTIATDLVEAEDEHAALRELSGAWLIDDQRRLAVARRDNLQAELDEALSIVDVAKIDVMRTGELLDAMAELVPSTSSTNRNDLLDQLRLREIELRLDLEAEKNLSGVRSQAVQALEQQLVQLQETIAEAPEYIVASSVERANPLRQSLQSRQSDARLLIETEEARIENLSQTIAEIDAELREMDRTGLALSRQSRRIERLRASELTFQRALDDARVAAEVSAASISNVIAVAEPQGSVAPVKPRVVRTLVIAMVFSLVAVSGVILIIDALRPKIRNNNDILPYTDPKTIVRAIS